MGEFLELRWTYTPIDLFEAESTFVFPEGRLLVGSGRAVFSVSIGTQPLSDAEVATFKGYVRTVFDVRRLMKRRAYDLRGPTIHHDDGTGGGSITAFVQPAIVGVSAIDSVDVVVADAAGVVTFDSRAARITREEHHASQLVSKAAESPLLTILLEVWGRAADDPGNELVHLYEIRDALKKHFGGSKAACAALGVSELAWSQFGRIANVEPIRQGRHRGNHLISLRNATPAELATARHFAKMLIEKFANTL